jgi:hypothetical protein
MGCSSWLWWREPQSWRTSHYSPDKYFVSSVTSSPQPWTTCFCWVNRWIILFFLSWKIVL